MYLSEKYANTSLCSLVVMFFALGFFGVMWVFKVGPERVELRIFFEVLGFGRGK